ncbi:TM2 domain-containing protein [Candidatus Haliotispira prima]|uniref:TM2 domain-containing protein n=1 Tax=Candidatus Haliotispira prima TaxID=3034016 RepID=A0ABY8MKU2_9SPIO|nr:TM2 domain-containing protein [Candidatus Haliotispira prima]
MSELDTKKEESADVSPKSRLVAVLLSWFLGYFGVHRFYLGRTKSAIMQILFGWLTFFIWNVVDLIMLLCGTFRDNEGKLVKDWAVK